MPELFETSSIGGITMRNRFVRSATWEGLAADDGACTAAVTHVVSELAKGQLGLIISSHAFVSPEGQAGPWQLGVYDDRLIPGLRNMAETAHGYGSKTLLQLAHAGLVAPRALTHQQPIGPGRDADPNDPAAREMSAEDIQRTVGDFVAAADRARQAGFDGVQIHAAHGFLLSQFLSPHFNHRSDAYGGDVPQRARIVLEILRQIKSSQGKSYPVWIKMNSEDFLDDGLTVDDMLAVAALLEEAGIDAIELSGGVNDPACYYSPVREGTPLTEEEEVYYRSAAARYKQRIQTPLVLVGGIRSFQVAEELVVDGTADAVALSRPLIREPHLIARWKSGDTQPSECRACNECFGPIRQGEGMRCAYTR
jgi:2,4-dienoyl-CoA reductase-like NADH-dependent reductase (Old Yellow Enzyme family)